MDSKAVLFVDNDQTERFVVDLILKQRMRANQKLALTAHEILENLLSLCCSGFTAEPAYSDSQWFKPGAKTNAVLFGQNFSGRHQARLDLEGVAVHDAESAVSASVLTVGKEHDLALDEVVVHLQRGAEARRRAW